MFKRGGDVIIAAKYVGDIPISQVKGIFKIGVKTKRKMIIFQYILPMEQRVEAQIEYKI